MRAHRIIALLVAGGVISAQASCYTYRPVREVSPQAGRVLELELTDAGRVALASDLGPGVLTVRGTLQQPRNDDYALRLTEVTSIYGGTTRWGGEPFTVPAAAVARTRVRTLSRGRTALVAAGVAAGVMAYVVTRTIAGGGSAQATDSSGKPIGLSAKAPWFLTLHRQKLLESHFMRGSSR